MGGFQVPVRRAAAHDGQPLAGLANCVSATGLETPLQQRLVQNWPAMQAVLAVVLKRVAAPGLAGRLERWRAGGQPGGWARSGGSALGPLLAIAAALQQGAGPAVEGGPEADQPTQACGGSRLLVDAAPSLAGPPGEVPGLGRRGASRWRSAGPAVSCASLLAETAWPGLATFLTTEAWVLAWDIGLEPSGFAVRALGAALPTAAIVGVIASACRRMGAGGGLVLGRQGLADAGAGTRACLLASAGSEIRRASGWWCRCF